MNARKLKLLLVDDQLTQLQYEQMLLGKELFDFVVARNGRDAVDMALAQQPDLILLDISMPEMDGLEATRRIRAQEETSQIPIIMVTTRGEERYMEDAFDLGCNEYVTKPVKKDELLAKIRSLTVS